MPAQAYWIDGQWRGRLAIVPRPRGGDWLADEVSGWRRLGFDLVVSLLTQDEVAEFDLHAEAQWSEAFDIEFVSFPIPDRGVPASPWAVRVLVDRLDEALGAGRKIAVHCRQGVGRSALIAACLLIASGVEPPAAFARISVARGCSVPDTPEQERWVTDYARELVPAK